MDSGAVSLRPISIFYQFDELLDLRKIASLLTFIDWLLFGDSSVFITYLSALAA